MYTGIKVSTFRERFSILFSESEKTVMELAKENWHTISKGTNCNSHCFIF